MKKTKAAEAADAETRTLVDQYGELAEELVPFKTKFKRFEELAKLLRDCAGAADPAAPVKLMGEDYEVVLSPRENRTLIAMPDKIYRRLGKLDFLRVASVTLSALQKFVHPQIVAELTQVERIGPRSITVMRRPE